MVRVLTEQVTLGYAGDFSLARFGDGELRLAVDGSCSSQRADPKLAQELRDILAGKAKAIPCVPNFEETPRKDVWDKYAKPPFSNLYSGALHYGSSFITRPDNAPWIDTPEYWAEVRKLWEGKDVMMVCSEQHSSELAIALENCGRRWVIGPREHAYSDIDRIEEEIGRPSCTVLLSLGATATVLAARLADKGVHALDLGHIWHFMKHARAFSFSAKDLRSKDYANQLHAKHRSMKWGRSGHSHAATVVHWANQIGATSVLDYGCGQATLAKSVPELKVTEYDPGIRGKDHMPKPAQMVVCTDVLEHIEPECIRNVLDHQYALAEKGAYFVIALTPARETLPDGRNAHLLLRSPEWWLENLVIAGWKIERYEVKKGLAVWARK